MMAIAHDNTVLEWKAEVEKCGKAITSKHPDISDSELREKMKQEKTIQYQVSFYWTSKNFSHFCKKMYLCFVRYDTLCKFTYTSLWRSALIIY